MEIKETVKLNKLALSNYRPHAQPIFVPVERFVYIGSEKHAVILDSEGKEFICPEVIK
jgi:hypothetical protein